MKRREQPESAPLLPPHLAVFDPAMWPGAPVDSIGSDRQWRRLRWNRARRRYLREMGSLR